jgi:hypothetical protein
MAAIEGDREGRKSVHNETKKEQAVSYEVTEKFAVAHALIENPVFQQKAGKVAESSNGDRAAAALREAKDYATNRGPAQRAIANLLVLLAEGSPSDPAFRLKVSNAGSKAFWAEDELEPEDAVRRRQRLTVSTGAQLLRRRGAGLCLDCEVRLTDRWEWSSARRTRRDYCGACSLKQHSSDRGAIEAALQVLSGQRATRRHARRRQASP